MPPKNSHFPAGFYFGAATSAHQVEGGSHNDWAEWEKQNSERLALEASKQFADWLPAWNDIKAQATDPKNYVSGLACDHWNRYEEDFDLMKQMGLNAYRFSIEWSRVEPKRGVYDQKAINHYRKMIEALKARGIEPFVTLWHWTLPLWFARSGGWSNPKAIDAFNRYAQKMTQELPQVQYWLTLNEPDGWAFFSQASKRWPPGQGSLVDYFRVTRHLTMAHKLAYKTIKQQRADAKVGIAQNVTYFEAPHNKLIERFYKLILGWWVDRRFLNHIRHYQDFLGLNYYFHVRLDFKLKDAPKLLSGNFSGQNQNRLVSDSGWELYPRGIYPLVKDLYVRYKKPIYITENGLADSQDINRSWFIEETLTALARAVKDGVDVRGYFHWSLIDNFEWDQGFWPRLGLVAVDYATQKRTMRPSAKVYARIIESNQPKSR